MRVDLIANPFSGRGAGPGQAEELIRCLRARGHAAEIHRGSDAADAAAWAAAASARADRLVVLGGDGTLSSILGGLPPEPPPVAFVPTGTSNLVAHELRLPRRPDQVADILERGCTRSIDLGAVNGRPAVLVWDFGAGGELMRRMEAARKGPIRKQQYVPIAWRMIREWRCPPQQVIADGEDLGEFELGIVAGLSRYASRAFRLGPSLPDDGLWELYLLRRFRLREAVRLACSSLLGGIQGCRAVLHRRVRAVSVRGAAPAPVQVDGDYAGTSPVEFRLGGRKLPLLVRS